MLLPGYVTQIADPSAEQIGQQISHACCDFFNFTQGHEQIPWQASLQQVLKVEGAAQCLPSARLASLQMRDDHDHSSELVSNDVLHADPVFLKADRDSAKLIPAQVLNLDATEADELLGAINAFVKDDGLIFTRDDEQRWFVSGKSATGLESYPPSFLANRNTSTFMPEGPDSPYWRRLMTELQMLLHTHPVNQAREKRGAMPINSVWFWGGGVLPEPVAELEDVALFADEHSARQLATYLQVKHAPLSELEAQIDSLPATHTVIVDTSLMQAWVSGDAHQLAQVLTRQNDQWIAPLAEQVRDGQLHLLTLLTEDGLQGVCTQASARPAAADKPGWLQRIVSAFR